MAMSLLLSAHRQPERDGAHRAEARVVAAVAGDAAVVALALLRVALEPHVVREHLRGEHRDLLRGGEVHALVEGHAVDVRLGHELLHSAGKAVGLLLDHLGEIAGFLLALEARDGEVEAAAHLRPAAEEARAFHLGEGLRGVGVGQVQRGREHSAVDGLRDLADELAGVGVERSAFLLVVRELARIHAHAVLAAGAADEGRQPLAGSLAAAALTVVAQHRQHRQHAVTDLCTPSHTRDRLQSTQRDMNAMFSLIVFDCFFDSQCG